MINTKETSEIAELQFDDFKLQMKRIKKELKSWEQEFLDVNGRKPEKKDIANVPEIAIRYKLYAKMKKEETNNQNFGSNQSLNQIPRNVKPVSVPEKIISTDKLSNNNNAIINEAEIEKRVDVKLEEAVPELPPRKAYKSNILAGPIAKSEVGQNLSRFAKRLQEQQVQKSQSDLNEGITPGIISYSSNVQKNTPEPSFQPTGEAQVFFNRKQQLEEITNIKQSVNDEPEPINTATNSIKEYTPVFEIGKTLHVRDDTPILIQVGKSCDSINQIAAPEPIQSSKNDIVNEIPEDLKKGSSSSLEQVEKKKTIPNSPKLEKKPLTESKPQVFIEKKESEEFLEETKESDKSNDLLSPIGDVIMPTNDLNEANTNVPQVLNSSLVDNTQEIVKNIPSLVIENIFLRLPKHGILRCKLIRKKTMLGKGQPTYLLHNEANNAFLLSAKKLLMSKSINYIISDHPEEISKDSPHYIAKLKANFMRTHFTLSDTRSPSRQRELACVVYSKNVLPRELQVAISAIEISEDAQTGFTEDIQYDFKSNNQKKLLFMKNKVPRWNEATQSHCLNFSGRVTLPSIKNMQLVCEMTGENYNLLQFGRCGADYFTLDIRWPMTPLEAFGIAITTFDAYDSA